MNDKRQSVIDEQIAKFAAWSVPGAQAVRDRLSIA